MSDSSLLPIVDYQIAGRGDVIDPGSNDSADRLYSFLGAVAEALDLRLPDGTLIPPRIADIASRGCAYHRELAVTLHPMFLDVFGSTEISISRRRYLHRELVAVYVHECAHRLVGLLPDSDTWAMRSHSFVFGVTNLAITIRLASLRDDYPFSHLADLNLGSASHATTFLVQAQLEAGRLYCWSDVLGPGAASDRDPGCVAAWDQYALWLHIGVRAAARLAVSALSPAQIAAEAAHLGAAYCPDFHIRPSWARRLPWSIVHPAFRHSVRIQRAAQRFFAAVEAGRR